jgi:hypothetical protein
MASKWPGFGPPSTPEQFDAFVWLAETTAVTPLAEAGGRAEGADTFPFGA